jgi:threonine synthase
MTNEQLVRFRATGALAVESDQFAEFVDGSFRAERCTDVDTLAEIGRVYRDTGILIDPHTATGTYAARRLGGRDGLPVVTLATAHPSKFPDAVERATGVRPELPVHLADLYERPERTHTLPAELLMVEQFVRSVGRISS